MFVTVHCEPRIKWQNPFAQKLRQGLAVLGIRSTLTNETNRISDDLAILLGTTCWRAVEATGKYLLVDRCSFGDTNQYVSLVLNGHGRRGDHRVPENFSYSRWSVHGVPLGEWNSGGDDIVLCGQCESYSPRFVSMPDWYRSHPEATHFRPHPAQPVNPTLLPEKRDWRSVGRVITLNSSIGVETLMAGIPTVVDDEGGMGWGVTQENRLDWCRWLAWTQWHHDEIAEGKPIAHLFDQI